MPRGRRGGRGRAHRAHRAHHTNHHHHQRRRRRMNFGRMHTRGGGGVRIGGGQPVQCTKSCCRVFLAVLIMLVGIIVTMVGNLAKPFWGPEHDSCGFCKVERLTAERNLRNCRIVGSIFLVVGFVVFVFFCRLHQKSKNDETQNASDVENQQTSAAGAEVLGIPTSEMTGVIVYPPPPPAAAGMPGFTYPQPPFPVMPTAPYLPNPGGDFAYPPSTPQFSFPTAVESDIPPPSYEAAVAVDNKPDTGIV